MNKQRRKRIQEVYDAITEKVEELTMLMEEEQEAYDNLPESIQNGERGEQMQSHIDNLESAISDFESGADCLADVLS